MSATPIHLPIDNSILNRHATPSIHMPLNLSGSAVALSLQLDFSAFLDSKTENSDDAPPQVSST